MERNVFAMEQTVIFDGPWSLSLVPEIERSMAPARENQTVSCDRAKPPSSRFAPQRVTAGHSCLFASKQPGDIDLEQGVRVNDWLECLLRVFALVA